MLASDVDGIPGRLLAKPKCKIAKLGDALRLGAAVVATGQLPSEFLPTLAATESNARII
jgi:hypothetical protein